MPINLTKGKIFPIFYKRACLKFFFSFDSESVNIFFFLVSYDTIEYKILLNEKKKKFILLT